MKATPTKTHPLDIETFTITPNEAHRVVLGVFPANTPQPKFRVIYHDQRLESPTVATYRDVPLEGPDGTIKLTRLFQSYSQVPHTITVRFASLADKEWCG